MTDDLLACPVCESANVEKSGAPSMDGGGIKPEWACRACGERFDSPLRRERKYAVPRPGGLAGDLFDADPDEVTR